MYVVILPQVLTVLSGGGGGIWWAACSECCCPITLDGEDDTEDAFDALSLIESCQDIRREKIKSCSTYAHNHQSVSQCSHNWAKFRQTGEFEDSLDPPRSCTLPTDSGA